MGKAKNIKYSSKSSLGLSGLVMPPPHPTPHQEGRHTTQHTHFSRISFVKKPYLATRLKIFQNSVQMYNIQIYTRLLPKKDITIKDRDGLSVTYHRGHLNPRNMRGCWTTWKTLHYIMYMEVQKAHGALWAVHRPSSRKEGHLPDNAHRGTPLTWGGEGGTLQNEAVHPKIY